MLSRDECQRALNQTEIEIVRAKRLIAAGGAAATAAVHDQLKRLRIEARAYRRMLNRETTE